MIGNCLPLTQKQKDEVNLFGEPPLSSIERSHVINPHATSSVGKTLEQNSHMYGNFAERAKIIQDLKTIMKKGRRWNSMSDDKKESLEMIVHKISRIVNGDPEYKDSWHDISGYAQLIEDTLKD